jgi:hypothetical protein
MQHFTNLDTEITCVNEPLADQIITDVGGGGYIAYYLFSIYIYFIRPHIMHHFTNSDFKIASVNEPLADK